MKITVLFENTRNPNTSFQKLTAGHGLSLYIETKEKRILFDMGQGNAFAENAKLLGTDLSNLDFAVISHGHYDHGGGLGEFLKINPTAPVYLRKSGFGNHYSGFEKYIGLDRDLKNHPRIIFTESDIEICQGIRLVSLEKTELKYSMQNNNMLIRQNSGDFLPDLFDHEQYLVITENSKTTVFSGCCHKGCANVAAHFNADFMVGGFHLSKIPLDKDGCFMLEKTASVLEGGKTVFFTCHCTGKEQFDFLKGIMEDRLFYLSTGDTVTL